MIHKDAKIKYDKSVKQWSGYLGKSLHANSGALN